MQLRFVGQIAFGGKWEAEWSSDIGSFGRHQLKREMCNPGIVAYNVGGGPMSEGNLSIEESVLALEPRRRAQLAATLIQSLEAADVDAIEAQELEELWLAEIEDRVARFDSGETKTVSWSEVKRRLLSRPK